MKNDLRREEDCEEELIITHLSNLLMKSLITDNRCIFRLCVSKMSSETSLNYFQSIYHITPLILEGKQEVTAKEQVCLLC